MNLDRVRELLAYLTRSPAERLAIARASVGARPIPAYLDDDVWAYVIAYKLVRPVARAPVEGETVSTDGRVFVLTPRGESLA